MKPAEAQLTVVRHELVRIFPRKRHLVSPFYKTNLVPELIKNGVVKVSNYTRF
jgi:hypothetical protein